jgi:hypothetical protein
MADPRKYAEWLVANEDKRGTPEFDTVAQAYRQARSQVTKVNTKSPADYPPTEGFLSDVAAGAGKTVVGVGRGIQQITGLGDQAALQETIDESRRLDAPLRQSAGGVTGEIGAQVGMAVAPGAALLRGGNLLGLPSVSAAGNYLLSSPATLGGVATQAGLGATLGAVQPVATGESRGRNVTLGALGGAAVPASGMALGTIRGAVEPLYSGGRDVIAGRAIRRAAGESADDVMRRLQQARILVPGSQPTAAEVAQSPGVAALQRAASAVDPEAYGIRTMQQNEARVTALQGISGTEASRDAARASRAASTAPLYRQAIEAGVDPQMSAALKPQIANLMDRPSVKYAIEQAKGIMDERSVTLARSGSVEGLQLVKQALDDAIERGSSATSKVGAHQLRALQQTRSDLISVMQDIAPQLRSADAAYAAASRPINQMDIGAEIAQRSINPLTGVLQPQSYARNLTDDLASRATGRSGATLAGTLGPGQLGTLQGIRDDLARSVAARDMGRGVGSDTVQKLAMTNLMERSGVPLGVLNFPGMGAIGRFTYQNADDLIKQRLAEGLLSPSEAARLMQAARANPNVTAFIEATRRITAPGILGGSMLLNPQQQ